MLDIYEVIALDKPLAAERWLTEIEERAAMLVEHPRLGVRRPEFEPSARILSVGNYLIVYETHPDTDEGAVDEVEIVRVVHGQRDLSRVF
ncbi:type II toxin-antitoxin system RelE/ParE family toxin [Granulicella sp. 5B5]|uniref:type II toxin-antitoxin system RelE/ParE family toxin n=1 Tax=Granulicella sp. 5B5 TaxID=1617967 RepID=UPI001C716241|nr:type II toxin-antitoxin system RelE/ParE family toxin [Granulicella sp. 5B5]